MTVTQHDKPADLEVSESVSEDIAPAEARIELADYRPEQIAALVTELGIGSLTAQVLARRGFVDPAKVREMLEPEDRGDRAMLPGLEAAVELIARHVCSGGRIAVHGDYDVDGVCSTAILVRTLARLSAEVTWHVPSRFDDGYGLSRASIDRFSRDGVELVIAVDCGITAVDETTYARELGIDVVVADHHKPGSRLPDAAIVHPGLGDYPFPDLCATAVAYKLARALTAELDGDQSSLDQELALVALATVCDVVPLRDENRELVVKGLAELRATTRPGLRELMRAAAVDQLTVDAGSLGFRLGPRINAAGRMQSAEPAVELLLTDSEQRAAELATQISGLNSRRQEVERSILSEAETQARHQRDAFAIVVAGQRWHPGVLGIVAGRIAERYRRPCVALTNEDGVSRGSGRSGGVYDLHEGLSACSKHLVRFGGHRAAAGLELLESSLPAFRTAIRDHAATVLSVEDLRPRVCVDAVADPSQLTITAAEELARLGPFGAGNPEPSILIPAVRVTNQRKMGDTGRHLRLTIDGHGTRGSVVAFNWDQSISSGDDAPYSNLVVKLSLNHWRGNVEAQSRLVAYSAIAPTDENFPSARPTACISWISDFIDALDTDTTTGRGLDLVTTMDRRFEGTLPVVASFADRADTSALVVNESGDWPQIQCALAGADSRLAKLRYLTYRALAAEMPATEIESSVTDSIQDFILVEPPPAPSLVNLPERGRVTIAWGRIAATDVANGLRAVTLGRDHVVSVYRALKSVQALGRPEFESVLAPVVEDPTRAGLAVRVLEEIGVITLIRVDRCVESIQVADAPRTELERSKTFRSYSALREEATKWHASLTADR